MATVGEKANTAAPNNNANNKLAENNGGGGGNAATIANALKAPGQVRARQCDCSGTFRGTLPCGEAAVPGVRRVVCLLAVQWSRS